MADPDATRLSRDLALRRATSVARRERVLEGQLQGLWFTLARFKWRSIVFVPSDVDGSTAGIATALADVGRRLRSSPVTFLVMAGSIDYASAGRFVTSVAGNGPLELADDETPSSRVIVAVPPVIVEPLALAVIDAADAVVLCVRQGSTRLADASRAVELIGRERIIGYVIN